MVNSYAKIAYNKGWAASKNTKTYDLDKAEAAFRKKHGREYEDDFTRGWTDYASGYDKYHSKTY